jgi:hypothetical protein
MQKQTVDVTTRAAELKTPAYLKLMKQRGEELVILVTPVMVGFKNEVMIMPRSLVAAYQANNYNPVGILTGDCLACWEELLTSYEKGDAARRLLALASKYKAELLDVPAELQPFIEQEGSKP